MPPGSVRLLAEHAELVRGADRRLHLTSIRDPDEFLERHIGESLEGAALIPRGTLGEALDLGSGNGYPAIPIAAAHAGLRVHLAEASRDKAGFLRTALARGPRNATVVERHVQRPADLADLPELTAITARAVGGWERILPRLAAKLSKAGRILLWAGPTADGVAQRVAWRNLELERRHVLPGRSRSWVFVFKVI
jgi:16S rRNA (guanine527-N7)-methyltransferase